MREWRKSAGLNVRKTSTFVIVINALQIGLMLIILGLAVFRHGETLSTRTARALVAMAAAVVAVGAALDIRDALNTRRLLEQADSMASTIGNMSDLNNRLRAQRHDFLNHLQVVHSLISMDEYAEANRYIERVYGDITAVSRVLRTANPAVNALLQVKLAACDKAGVTVDIAIRSDWKDLPVEGWEMCKVLSNLIDNALDALREAEDKRLRITLWEDLESCRFEVANTGPAIPEALLPTLFEPGVTTKAEGHGMGLHIVRETLTQAGGGIEHRRDGAETVFAGWVPRTNESLRGEVS